MPKSLEDVLKSPAFKQALCELFPAHSDFNELHNKISRCSIWWSLVLRYHEEAPAENEQARNELDRLVKALDQSLERFSALSRKARRSMDHRAMMHVQGKGSINEARVKVDEIAADLKSFRDIALVGALALPRKGRGRPRNHADELVSDLAEYWEIYSGKPATLSTHPVTAEKSGPFKDFCLLVVPPIYEDAGLPTPSIDSAIQVALYSNLKRGSR